MELSGEATISNLGDSKIQRTKHITQTDCPNRLRKQTAQEDLTATQTDSPNRVGPHRVPKQIAQSEYFKRFINKQNFQLGILL